MTKEEKPRVSIIEKQRFWKLTIEYRKHEKFLLFELECLEFLKQRKIKEGVVELREVCEELSSMDKYIVKY